VFSDVEFLVARRFAGADELQGGIAMAAIVREVAVEGGSR
jgi:hypothetical protein